MQPDSTQQFKRSKKYDKYVSGDLNARENILPTTGTGPQNSYQAPSYQPVAQPQASYQPQQNPVTSLNFKATNYAPPNAAKKMARKPLALKAVMKATVQIERVTKNSISVVKQTFEPDLLNAIRTKRQRIFARSVYSVGVASFLFLVGFGTNQLISLNKPPSTSDVLGLQTNGVKKVSNEPSEQKPSDQDIKTYLVAASYPRYISIPGLSLNARVRRLGIDSKGAVAFPTNIYDIGWYDGSVKPGENEGPSILIGHLMGATQQGALWGVDKLVPGDSIYIEKGDGTTIHYRITKLYKAQPEDDISTFITPENNGKHDLTILSAYGMYSKVSDDTQKRTVIFATQI